MASTPVACQNILMHPPRIDLWPIAVVSAERVHGSLTRCGPGYRPKGWPDSAHVRRVALGRLLPNYLIASHITAAWVWQAALSPNPGESPLRAIAHPSKRTANRQLASSAEIHISHSRIARTDMVYVDDLAVTTPLRTVLDLLRDRQTWSVAQQSACKQFFRSTGALLEIVREELTHVTHPANTIARERLDALKLPGLTAPRHTSGKLPGASTPPSGSEADGRGRRSDLG